MRRFFWALVLPTFLGCSGPIVAEEKKTSSEQLQSGMESWCSQACDRLETCRANQPCDCAGHFCACATVPGDCVRNCQHELTKFAHHETCADLALQMQRCIDYSSCKQLLHDEDWPDCYPSKTDREACKQGGQPDSPPVSGSGGESNGSDQDTQK